MKRIIINIIFCLCYLGGVLLFAWPDIKHLVSEQENQAVIQEFDQVVKGRKVQAESSAGDGEKEITMADTEPDMEALASASDELLQAMKKYNIELYESEQTSLQDPWSYETESLDLTQYGINNNLIGILKVPKMDLELPIYLGANETNMAKGAALLGQTSFPLTGNNTNVVLAAHRGWKGIPMFREIQKLELGDRLTIQNYWETLTYQVTDIMVVMPDEIDKIFIQPDKNMVTLITCHPYTKNSRRYVVCCELVGVNLPEETITGQESGEASTQEQLNESSTNGQADDTNTENAFTASGGTQQESAEQIRESAIEEDKETMAKEKQERIIGYVVIAILGVVSAVAMFGTGKKKQPKAKTN